MDNKFVHLHVHTHYSTLDGMSKIPELVDRAIELKMPAIAITDHGNMFGVKEFTDYINSVNKDGHKIKAIIGSEFYCARRTLKNKDSNYKIIEDGKEIHGDHSGWHLILLAKNKTGYRNLCALSSISWISGNYIRPRIDKEILEKHHEGLICCSACIGGELPKKILSGDLDGAKETIKWFKRVFGDDYYIELQRHETNKIRANKETFIKQEKVNPILIKLAKEFDVKLVCTNDVHFVNEEDSEAHEHLICLSTAKRLGDPTLMSYTKQEYLKSADEMAEIFSDIPEAVENTLEVADKVEEYSIENSPIMPKFPIPEEFGTEEEYRKKYTEADLREVFCWDQESGIMLEGEEAEAKIKKMGGYDSLYRTKLEYDYLRKLTYEGAHKKYGDTLPDEVKERLEHELKIMAFTGFPGYFLIVSDYIRAANEELGVSTGSGRGCIYPDEMVKMANGSEKKISKIKEGDIVISGMNYVSKVAAKMIYPLEKKEKSTKLRMVDNSEIKLTSDHKVLVIEYGKPLELKNAVWKEAGKLKRGDRMIKTSK